MKQVGIKCERTGGLYSFGGVEYAITFPNGDRTIVWSPPWSETDDDEKDRLALEYAAELYESGEYIRMKEVDGKLVEKYIRDMKIHEWAEANRELKEWQLKAMKEMDSKDLDGLLALAKTIDSYIEGVTQNHENDHNRVRKSRTGDKRL